MSARVRVITTLNAADEFSAAASGDVQAEAGTAGVALFGDFALDISGTFVGNLTPQVSRDGGVTFIDVTTNDGTAVVFTVPGTYWTAEPVGESIWRVGFKTGDFTSGAAVVGFKQ